MQKRHLSIIALTLVLTATPIRAQEVKDTTQIAPANPPTEQTAEQEAAEKSKFKKFMSEVAEHIKIHGYAQAGYTYQKKGDDKGTNTFDLKRTLLWVNAQIIDRWSFLFMHDFNSQVQEFYTDFRITKNNALSVRFGQFKNALSLENPLSPTSMETIDVYSESVTFLTGCGSDPLMGVQYGRDLGLSLFGETNDGKFRYEFQVMNGQGINKKDKNRNKDFIERIEWRPVKGLNIVASAQLGKGHAIDSSLYNPDIKVGEDYTRNRYSVGLGYTSKAFNVHGEFLQGRDGNARSLGGYVTGSVALIPTKLDLIGSYDFFNFNTDLDMDQHKGVFGIQYWFYKRCRVQLQYVYKSAYTAGYTFVHGNNHALMCQVQVRFN